jgi:hypothetical protein
MPVPAAVGIGAAVAPALGALFSGGPNIPSYSPAEIMRMISEFQRMLVGGPLGQAQLNQASIQGNNFAGNVRAAQARSGLNMTGVGNIAGAGAQSVSALNRGDVLAQLAELAKSLTQTSLAGQTNAGMAQFNNPSGLKALLGILGTSAGPLLMQTQKADPWKVTPPGGTPPFNPRDNAGWGA